MTLLGSIPRSRRSDRHCMSNGENVRTSPPGIVARQTLLGWATAVGMRLLPLGMDDDIQLSEAESLPGSCMCLVEPSKGAKNGIYYHSYARKSRVL